MVTCVETTEADGPLLFARSLTPEERRVRATVPAAEHCVVTSIEVPDVADGTMVQGNAVPATEKSPLAIPLTDSLKSTRKTGLSVPAGEVGDVIVAVGAVVSRVTLDDELAEVTRLPA
jgi:hypothetical protein